MAIQFTSHTPPADPSDIVAFESLIGSRLPDTYRRFLLRTNGGNLEHNLRFFEHNGGQVDVSVRRFFGAAAAHDSEDLARQVPLMKDRTPPGFIVIGDAPAGDKVLLSVRSEDAGALWFWEHEFEASEDEEADFRNMIYLAPSIDEFLESQPPFDVDAWIRDNVEP
jgi:hypothetical protein